MSLRIWSLLCVLALIQLTVGLPVEGQSPQPEIGVKHNLTIASTLDAFSIPAMPSNMDSTATQDVELGPTIKRFAEIKELSIEDARLETLLFLGMTPRIKAAHWAGQSPTFRVIDGDRYRVTAPKSFFDSLPAMKLCLELGKKQVAITCQMISLPPKQSMRLNAFITPGTAEVYCAKMPEIAPVATANSISAADEFDTDTFISSSTIVRNTTPVTTGSISKENLDKLKHYLKSTKTETIFAPNVVTFPGQLATISDASKRPFVIGLEAIHGEFARIGNQPIVQAIEDGVTVRLKAIPHDGKIHLFSDIAISEVGDVHTLTFAGSGERNQQTIQVPEHRIRQIHLSTLLDPDSAILIDPNFIQNDESKGAKKAMFILQAKMIDMD